MSRWNLSTPAARISRSIDERARYRTRARRHRELSLELGVNLPNPYSVELLETLASIKALAGTRWDVLIDVGAFKGHFAGAADAAFDIPRLICFEPNAEMHSDIRRNVDPGKLELHAVALSDHAGTADFYLHADRSMSSMVSADDSVIREKFARRTGTTIRRQSVEVRRLDDVVGPALSRYSPGVLLKIDVQGNELHVLKGAVNTLRSTDACLVEHMFCTPYRSDYTFEDLIAFMVASGFHCAGALSLTRRPTHEVSAVDFLFVKRSAPVLPPAASREQ